MENEYPRAVLPEGNREAQRMIEEVFVVADRAWRGLGEIPASGYALAPRYAGFDAEKVFEVAGPVGQRAGGVPERARAAGTDRADRLPRVRLALHARAPARSDDGLGRGSLRGLLPLPARTRAGRSSGARRGREVGDVALDRSSARLPRAAAAWRRRPARPRRGWDS